MVDPTPEQLAEMARVNPMRTITYLRCVDCGREWSQPASAGSCPACHGGNVVSDGQKISSYKRV